MSKHTPGPWHIDGCRIRGGYEDVVALGPGVGFEGTRDDANARLIAAAPEMLELLREVAEDGCETGCFARCEHTRARVLCDRVDG